MGSIIKEGIAFGAGNAMGHRIEAYLFGSMGRNSSAVGTPPSAPVPPKQEIDCASTVKEYQTCLKDFGSAEECRAMLKEVSPERFAICYPEHK